LGRDRTTLPGHTGAIADSRRTQTAFLGAVEQRYAAIPSILPRCAVGLVRSGSGRRGWARGGAHSAGGWVWSSCACGCTTRGACETDRGRGEARPRLRPEAYLTP